MKRLLRRWLGIETDRNDAEKHCADNRRIFDSYYDGHEIRLQAAEDETKGLGVLVYELTQRLGAAEKHCAAADQAFIECAAEIERLRESLATAQQQPPPNVRRATSFGDFRAAAEHVVHKARDTAKNAN